MKIKGLNLSNPITLTYLGETKTLKEWGKTLGISKHCLYGRIMAGWTVEKALTTPCGER